MPIFTVNNCALQHERIERWIVRSSKRMGVLIDSICVLSIAARMKIEALLAVVLAVLLTSTLPVANGFAQSERASKLSATDQSGQNYARGSIVKGHTIYEDTGQSAPRERVQLVAVE